MSHGVSTEEGHITEPCLKLGEYFINGLQVNELRPAFEWVVSHICIHGSCDGVAMISRLLQHVGLVCRT